MTNDLIRRVREAKLTVIGASAGGVEALRAVLPSAHPAHTIVVVLHRPESDSSSLLPEIFEGASEPEDKEPLRPRSLYFAPAGYHLLLERDLTFSLSQDPPVHFSRPAVDNLFETAAEAAGPGLLGIILTGANEDGARGLRAILDAGGIGVIQAPATAYASAMPLAALKLCPEATVLTLPEIKALLT